MSYVCRVCVHTLWAEPSKTGSGVLKVECHRLIKYLEIWLNKNMAVNLISDLTDTCLEDIKDI